MESNDRFRELYLLTGKWAIREASELISKSALSHTPPSHEYLDRLVTFRELIEAIEWQFDRRAHDPELREQQAALDSLLSVLRSLSHRLTDEWQAASSNAIDMLTELLYAGFTISLPSLEDDDRVRKSPWPDGVIEIDLVLGEPDIRSVYDQYRSWENSLARQ